MKIRLVEFTISFLVLGLLGWVSPVGAAQAKNKPHANPVGSAKSARDAAKREAEAARAAVVSAEATLKKVTDRAAEIRKSLDAEFDASPEVVAARKQQEQDKASLDQYKTPLMDKLQKQADYQALISARDAARKALKSKEYSEAILKIKKMEADVIDANPQAKAAQTALTSSEAKVRGLVEKHRETMLQDKRVVDVRAEIDKAKEAIAKARAKAANEQSQLAAAEKRLAQEEQKQHQPKNPPKKRR
jgi:hypothetical protein